MQDVVLYLSTPLLIHVRQKKQFITLPSGTVLHARGDISPAGIAWLGYGAVALLDASTYTVI